MDFKNYVRTMLEAEKAKDQDDSRAEDQDEDQDEDEDDDSDEDDDEDDDTQASVRTNKNDCTGSEASCGTDDEDCDDDSDDDEDDDDKKEEKKASSLKEAMIYSVRYGEKQSILTEEEKVLCEDIKNNSASKYLSKLSKKAEKEAAKFSKRGMSEEAAISKKSASALKEASNKLYRCETRYKAGDPTAKKEYKAICKQYSKELKSLGKVARGLKGLVFTLISGTILLGAIGTTVIANDNPDGGIIDKISKAIESFKEGKTERGFEVLGDIAENDKKFIKSAIDDTDFKGTDWAGKKADFDAQDNNWKNAAHRDNNTGYKIGKKIRDTAEAAGEGIKDTWGGIIQGGNRKGESIKDNARGLTQGLFGK